MPTPAPGRSRRNTCSRTIAYVAVATDRRREEQHHTGALTRAALDAHLALVGVNDVAHDTQADARSANLRIDGAAAAEKRFENMRKVGSVDADAAIVDNDAHAAAVPIGLNIHQAPRRAVL